MVELNALFDRLDRLGAGRQFPIRVDPTLLADPRVHTRWRIIRWLLAAGILVGMVAFGVVAVQFLGGTVEPFPVWMRSVVVLGLTLGLGYFALRAEQGRYWAYSRMRLFSIIFPIITVGLSLIPGFFPLWMTIEQLTFAALMASVAVLLHTPLMRQVYRSRA